MPDHIPIVFDNLSYDAHSFIKKLRRRFNKNYIGVIAENQEKYISFNVKINVKLAGVKYKDGSQVHKSIQLRFIDSCRFMASSLDKLASNLCGMGKVHRGKCKGNMEQINISIDYIASLGCEETSLPPKDPFYSSLNMRGISDQDYKHAQQVWNTMEQKTLECCHNIYLKTDALLLADVSETFQGTLRIRSSTIFTPHLDWHGRPY